MHIPRGKSFVFDSFFSVIIIQTNVETKSKKSPPMEIQTKKLTYHQNIMDTNSFIGNISINYGLMTYICASCSVNKANQFTEMFLFHMTNIRGLT